MGNLPFGGVRDENRRSFLGFQEREGKEESDGGLVRLTVGVADGQIIAVGVGDPLVLLPFLRSGRVSLAKGTGV